MDKEQARKIVARQIVEGFILQHSYTYTVDRVIDGYLNYYKQGFYVSHSMNNCIKHLGKELEVLTK